jgi:hypothetical protein
LSEAPHRRTAAALRQLAAEHPAQRLALGDLMKALGDQSFGLLILLLALPNAIPAPPVPFFSLPFALGIALLGSQLALGWQAPRLPGLLQRLSMDRERFRRMVDHVEPLLLRVERFLRPRETGLTDRNGERLVGVALIMLSLVLALPVPLGNTPVALSLSLMALGLLESDGRALIIGIAAGLAATLWNGLLIFAGAELALMAMRFF